MRSLALALVVMVCAALSCDRPIAGPPPQQAEGQRSYRLGFSANPPRLETAAVLQTVNMWMPRADAALLSLGVPWKRLLDGANAATVVRQEQLELVQLYRSHGISQITVMVDATNGLERDKEAPELDSAGRSITDPAIQALYREYIMAVDSVLHPSYLALAMETNLTRLKAPDSVYHAVVTMTGATATALRAAGTMAKLAISVQVDVASGRNPLTNVFAGIGVDLRDFPFIDVLGLSSYPYLAGFAEPEDVPLDYYARIAPSATMPMLVMEGGWTSGPVDGVSSTPEKQARWIKRQMELADSAHVAAVFQITFTDIDTSAFPGPANLALFAQLGMVDASFRPKPALAEWDAAFQRGYVPR